MKQRQEKATDGCFTNLVLCSLSYEDSVAKQLAKEKSWLRWLDEVVRLGNKDLPHCLRGGQEQAFLVEEDTKAYQAVVR